jgi:hypothetical protein
MREVCNYILPIEWLLGMNIQNGFTIYAINKIYTHCLTYIHFCTPTLCKRSWCENARNKKFSSSKFSSRTKQFSVQIRVQYNGGGWITILRITHWPHRQLRSRMRKEAFGRVPSLLPMTTRSWKNSSFENMDAACIYQLQKCNKLRGRWLQACAFIWNEMRVKQLTRGRSRSSGIAINDCSEPSALLDLHAFIYSCMHARGFVT